MNPPDLPVAALSGGIGDYREHWTRDQMIAYGRACAAAERERCARMFDIQDGIHGEAEDWCRAAATQIRALKDETP